MSDDGIPAPTAHAGVVPLVFDEGVARVVLITNGRGHWIFPKGGVGRRRSADAAALREAWEEAGLRGRVVPHELARYVHPRCSGCQEVAIYLMLVEQQHPTWPEAAQRQRRLVAVADLVEELWKPLHCLVPLLQERLRDLGLRRVA